MKLVIAGGSGHCGRLLINYFAANGHTVKVLSRGVKTIEGAETIH